MDYIKEENWKRVLRLVQGGVEGVTKLVCGRYKLVNRSKIKKQILKDDILTFNLNDIDVPSISDVIQSIAYERFEYYNREGLFHGFVDIFDNRDLKVKCYEFVDNSELLDYEKDELKEIINDFEYEISFKETVREVFEPLLYEYYSHVIDFIMDYTIERENRLQKLRELLNSVERCIMENEEILNSKAKPHLKEVLRLCNDNYIDFYNRIKVDLQDYISCINNSVNGEDGSEINYKESREYILNKLIDGTENRKLFFKYEVLMKEKGYLSNELNKWLLNPVNFTRFYVFCENNDIFYYKFQTTRKGIRLLRDLYGFYEGETMDYPNKRKKELDSSKEEYYFLYSA